MFDDIRPYRDDEVAAVIQKLISDDGLLSSICSFKMPVMYKLMPKACRTLVKWTLKLRSSKFHNIEEIQTEVAKYLHHLIKKSTDGFTFHGLEKIDTSKPMLFISNHRDNRGQHLWRAHRSQRQSGGHRRTGPGQGCPSEFGPSGGHHLPGQDL